MGISKMQGTYGYIEYIGEKKIRSYSCRNCYYYGEGVCNAKKIALNYSDYNGRICSYFDPINKSNKSKIKDKNKRVKYKAKNNKKSKKEGINNKRTIDTNDIINDIQLVRSKTKVARKQGNKFISSKSIVYISCIKNMNKNMIVNMCDKNIDRDLFNRLLDKPMKSTILYRDNIYIITNIVNGIVR